MYNVPVPTRIKLLEFIKTNMERKFIIPIYQRNYTWTTKREVCKFLEDLENILSRKNILK